MSEIVITHVFDGDALALFNGLRRKYDSKSASWIDAHVTVAGPVATDEAIAAIVERTRGVAKQHDPFDIELSGADTFLPVTNVSFARVVNTDALRALHDDLVRWLNWEENHAYIPHVTITAGLDKEQTERALRELRSLDIHTVERVENLSIYERIEGHGWNLAARAPLRG